MTSKNASAASEPATSLTDKEREAIAQMPYEEARDKLIQAVQALEAGGLNLDQSMRQWEIGEALAKRANSLLNEVKAKLDAAQAEQANSADTAGTQSNLDSTGHPTRVCCVHKRAPRRSPRRTYGRKTRGLRPYVRAAVVWASTYGRNDGVPRPSMSPYAW